MLFYACFAVINGLFGPVRLFGPRTSLSLRQAARENYLVDTGMESERFAARKYKTVHIQTLDEGLNKLGLEVGDIDYVIFTHAHHDHIANLRRFPQAKAIIQRAELEEARNPFEYTKPRLPADYPDLIKRVRWEIVEGDIVIDKNIELIFTPGHSAGGQSVAVKTSQGLAIITGFDCVQENFDPPEEIKKKGVSFYHKCYPHQSKRAV
jgi:N-acyl homoserine lactone hydrolase